MYIKREKDGRTDREVGTSMCKKIKSDIDWTFILHRLIYYIVNERARQILMRILYYSVIVYYNLLACGVECSCIHVYGVHTRQITT